MSLIRTLAVALAFAALAVPTAQAKFVDIHQPLIEQSMPPCPQNFSRNPVTKECLSPFESVKVPAAPAPASAPSAPAAEPSGGGIDWEDAGIGAGGTLAMMVLAGGAAMTVAHRRRGLRTAA